MSAFFAKVAVWWAVVEEFFKRPSVYVPALVVAIVVSWYIWGFLVQSVNTRRGFAGDWFLGGFLGVLPVPVGVFYFWKVDAANFTMFTNPAAFFNSGASSIAFGICAVLCFLIPVAVLCVALFRPQSEA